MEWSSGRYSGNDWRLLVGRGEVPRAEWYEGVRRFVRTTRFFLARDDPHASPPSLAAAPEHAALAREVAEKQAAFEPAPAAPEPLAAPAPAPLDTHTQNALGQRKWLNPPPGASLDVRTRAAGRLLSPGPNASGARATQQPLDPGPPVLAPTPHRLRVLRT